jgi:hypothetical protein
MTSRVPTLQLLFAGSLLLAASACSKNEDKPAAPAAPKADAPASTEITSEQKKGLPLDLVFAIKSQDMTADGTRVLEVRGTYNGTEVGLIVALGPKWETVAPETKSKFTFHTGMVEYRTIGAPSNALLAALDELYATKLKPEAMRTDVKFAATTLQGDPADLGKGEVRIKLVHESTNPELQAEIFTNVDLGKHVVHILEKDAANRPALIRALKRD